jgi:hypothetical protein
MMKFLSTFFFILFLLPLVLLAQEAVDPAPLIPVPIESGTWIEFLASRFPLFISIVAIIGTSRLIFKALHTFIRSVVQATPTKKDDLMLDNAEKSKAFKFVVWLVDYIASIKLPVK